MPLLTNALRRLHEFVEEIAQPTPEVTDVKPTFDQTSRTLAIEMERDFSVVWVLARYDIVLSGFDRLSAARTDERRSLVH